MTKKPANEKNIYAILAEKAAEATDLRLLVQNIIQHTLDYMQAAFGSIMVYNKEDDSLKLYASSSHPVFAKGAVKDKKTKISKSDSIAAKVFSSGKPIIFKKDTKTNASKLKLSRADDNGSFMSVPLTISKRIIGVINLNRTAEQESFSSSDLVKLSGINVFIASLIDKETLLEKIETNRKEISALYQMSNLLSESNDFKGRLEEFLLKLSKELGMKRSAIIKTLPHDKDKKTKQQNFEIIASHNLKKNHLESMFKSASEHIKLKIKRSSALAGINSDDTPLTLEFNDGKDNSEMYCVPLFIQDNGIYFLIVSRNFVEDDEINTNKHYRFLQVISHNISSAISREKMLKTIHEDKEILRESAERNRIFFEISKDLGSTLDPYLILQKAFNQFNKIISFTTISILLYDDLDAEYKLIVQPSEPISLKYQNNLTNSIINLFKEYPSEPLITKENTAAPTFFNPHNPDAKQVASFKNVLHLPIILGNSVKGLIHLARKGNQEFTPHELDITSQFTGIFITSIKNALIHKRTEKLAFTDPLTELYNHRFFQETLLQEFTRSERYKKPLSLMIIDIDFFKKFNDTYGHLVGDKVLKHVSAIFKSSMREQIDTVARYGGEEFGVILPETSLEGAAVFAERIRKKVEESFIQEGDKKLKVTLSIGVSCISVTKCTKTSDLIEAADQALYKAKAEGRNQVQTYKESEVYYEKNH
jgi:diguanylate cyclase (GGDEF)-like protein